MKLHNFYPFPKLSVIVDDITALLMGKDKVVAEMAQKLMRMLKGEVEAKIVGHRGWKRRKEWGDCVVQVFGGKYGNAGKKKSYICW